MKLGETNPALRRIYLTIFIADGSALATDVDSLSPTVLVASNGATLVAAGGPFAHVSGEHRLHYYEASASEALVPGFLLVVVVQSSIETARGFAWVGQTFALGETDAGKLRLPLVIEDLTEPPAPAPGAPVTTGADLQSSVNGAAFANDAGALVEIKHLGTGLGDYYWQAAASAAAVAGTVAVKYESTGFRLCVSTVVIEAPAIAPVVPATPLGPPAIPFDATLASHIPSIDLISLALNRLPHQYRGTNG